MLDYTKAAIEKTLGDFKRFAFFYNIATQALYISYLIYAIFAPAGNLVINVVLFGASCAYFVFYLVMHEREGKSAKQLRDVTRHVYKWFKLAVKLFSLSIMLYSIYIATTHVTLVSVILAAMTVVTLSLQVLIEVAVGFFESRAKLILSGIEADFDNLLKPVHTVGNFIKKVKGQEPEPEKEPSKNRVMLEKRVSEIRAERARHRGARKRFSVSSAVKKIVGNAVQKRAARKDAKKNEGVIIEVDVKKKDVMLEENNNLLPEPKKETADK